MAKLVLVGLSGPTAKARASAAGAASTAAAHVKKRHAVRRHYHVQPWSDYMEIIWSDHSQIYVTPIGREEICIVVLSEKAEHASFEDALCELPNLAGKLAGAKLASRERGAITVMCTLENLQRDNVALVGDASGGVDAITGEGLRLTFRQALALADAMAAEDLTLYQQAHATICRHPMRMGRLMLWLGRHPRIRDRAIRALQDNPNLFTRLLATHIGKISAAEILFTSAQLGWGLLAI